MVSVPNRNSVNNLVNKVRMTGMWIDRKPKHQHWILTEEKLDDIGAQLEQLPCKSLKTHWTRDKSIKRGLKNYYKIIKATAWQDNSCAVTAAMWFSSQPQYLYSVIFKNYSLLNQSTHKSSIHSSWCALCCQMTTTVWTRICSEGVENVSETMFLESFVR